MSPSPPYAASFCEVRDGRRDEERACAEGHLQYACFPLAVPSSHTITCT